MIRFETLEETRVNDAVAALEKLYDQTPVSAKRIGATIGLDSPQTLIYLHAAEKQGRAKPLRTVRSDVTRG